MARIATTSQQVADATALGDRSPQAHAANETDYLCLTDRCTRLLEFADGRIEELREPTDSHQSILALLFSLFDQYVRNERGVALFAPLRLRIREGRYREPDLMLLRDANDPRRQDRYWLGADLLVEVVSPDDPERDYRQKRDDYADLRIPEYWIVDPQAATITVLTLHDGRYVDHGFFGPGDVASSATLRGFRVPVSDVLNSARRG